MDGALWIIVTAIVVILGYRYYASRVDREVLEADPNRATPATMYQDGVDFMPASGSVLFGYQFKSIAALGPIVGPITAVQWGWLPSLLWLVIGVFFIGWVQDYASAILAMRNEGMTMGGLSYKLISPRARTLLLSFLYFYLLLIMGAFGSIVAGLLANPQVPMGLLILTLAGVLAGYMTYTLRRDLIMTTVVTVAIALIGIWLGTTPILSNIATAINGLAGTGEQRVLYNSPYGPMTWPVFFWGIIALLFCYAGSVLPIWRFAQPVNYVSFWLVLLGMIGSIVGILIAALPGGASASYSLPAFNTWDVPALGPLWPILFVTISCGAVSGWHSLVSTSGTARQLEKETDALPVAGGAMYAEAVLGVLSLTFAATALNFEATAGQFDPATGFFTPGTAAGGVFAGGMANFLNLLGVPRAFGVAFGSAFLAIMALTVMQLVLRFMRVAMAELAGDAMPIVRNIHVGSWIGIALTLVILWTGFWQRIWVLFGGSNQLFAGLALLLIAIWLAQLKRPYNWAFIPGIFMYVTTVLALLYTGWRAFYIDARNPEASLPFVIGAIIAGLIALFLVVAALILAYDGIQSFNRARRAPAAPSAAAGTSAD